MTDVDEQVEAIKAAVPRAFLPEACVRDDRSRRYHPLGILAW